MSTDLLQFARFWLCKVKSYESFKFLLTIHLDSDHVHNNKGINIQLSQTCQHFAKFNIFPFLVLLKCKQLMHFDLVCEVVTTKIG